MSYTIQKFLTLINKGTKGLNNPQWIIEHFVGAAGQAWGNANYFKSMVQQIITQSVLKCVKIRQQVKTFGIGNSTLKLSSVLSG